MVTYPKHLLLLHQRSTQYLPPLPNHRLPSTPPSLHPTPLATSPSSLPILQVLSIHFPASAFSSLQKRTHTVIAAPGTAADSAFADAVYQVCECV